MNTASYSESAASNCRSARASSACASGSMALMSSSPRKPSVSTVCCSLGSLLWQLTQFSVILLSAQRDPMYCPASNRPSASLASRESERLR